MSEKDEITVRLNRAALMPGAFTNTTVRVRDSVVVAVRIWECATAWPSLRQGDNTIEWELTKRGTQAGQAIAAGEFEVIVEP